MGGLFNYCFLLVQPLPISHFFLLFCIFSVCRNKHQRLLYQKSIQIFLKSHLREGFPALGSLHRALKCINGPFVEPKRWTRYQEFTFSLDCSVWLNSRKRRNKDFPRRILQREHGSSWSLWMRPDANQNPNTTLERWTPAEGGRLPYLAAHQNGGLSSQTLGVHRLECQTASPFTPSPQARKANEIFSLTCSLSCLNTLDKTAEVWSLTRNQPTAGPAASPCVCATGDLAPGVCLLSCCRGQTGWWDCLQMFHGGKDYFPDGRINRVVNTVSLVRGDP